MLPIHLDINDCMEDIITALGGAERKLVGVVLNELNPTAVNVSETNNMRERRANPSEELPQPNVPRMTVGGLRVAVLDLEQTADFMVDVVFPRRRARPARFT